MDSRVAQLRAEVSAAAACLDDARTLCADVLEHTPQLPALTAEDWRTVRLAVNQALFKVRNANAALARLEDREKRCVV